jgi:electron transfer flavoprotein alpha subunit
LGVRPVELDDTGLADARVIVSAGKGIGKKENLSLLYCLAELFSKSTVAGSRLVCDMEWLEKQRQVGITGNTVAPELYIACGISGAVQHVAGMGDAGFVVAVNTDPHAAIFNVSDICIVEDVTTFIPEVLAAYKAKKESKHA